MTASNIIGADHERAMVACLRHLHAPGYSLADCAHPRRLGRSTKTLRRYARKAGLAFSDYGPRALKPKGEKAA